MTDHKNIEETVSRLSHDLKNPLTSSKLNIEMLMNGVAGELSPQQKEMLKDIADAQEQILDIIQGFRDSYRQS
jgi:signal transduction histidine kinase